MVIEAPLIVIANPGRQHSDQLAAALVENGFRVRYTHGHRISPQLKDILAPSATMRPLGQIISRLASKILPHSLATAVAQRTFASLDRQIARQVRKYRPAAVIAYENSANASFRAAKRVGAVTILDAASVHFTMQNEALTRFRAKVNATKLQELELADYVLNCSSLARDSYVAQGVQADRAIALPLGVDLTQFTPVARCSSGTTLRILFVGRLTRKKGADVLAEALTQMKRNGSAFELKVAADLDGVEDGMDAALGAHGELLGKVSHQDLADLYAWADVAVVPSRFDSFGLVVYEALACGLPVIVSDHVGAKDIIEHGMNGFIFPAEQAAALTGILSMAANDPDRILAMREPARRSVEHAGWADYRARAGATIASILGASS